jgi:hypothetical protein
MLTGALNYGFEAMTEFIRKTKKLLNWYLAHLWLNKYK